MRRCVGQNNPPYFSDPTVDSVPDQEIKLLETHLFYKLVPNRLKQQQWNESKAIQKKYNIRNKT